MVDYYRSIGNAIQFIESNLEERFSIEDVSKEAFQSRWHFQRVFRLVTGHSVYEYIKRRRLAEAGTDLVMKKEKVIDVAFKYGYGSPEAFTRAFTQEYGATPSGYKEVQEHRVFQKIDIANPEFRLEYKKGDIFFQPVTRNEITIVGRKYRTSMKNHQNEIDVPEAWLDFSENKYTDRIEGRLGNANYGVYYEWDYDENFSILLGCQVAQASILPDPETTQLLSHTIKPCKYMVFTIPGRENEDILAGWNYIYGTWMPSTGYERDFSEDFDVFDDRFYSDEPVSEIYIPIK
jgi:AraC family transcriptional regulator